jgi:hypothetical protein
MTTGWRCLAPPPFFVYYNSTIKITAPLFCFVLFFCFFCFIFFLCSRNNDSRNFKQSSSSISTLKRYAERFNIHGPLKVLLTLTEEIFYRLSQFRPISWMENKCFLATLGEESKIAEVAARENFENYFSPCISTYYKQVGLIFTTRFVSNLSIHHPLTSAGKKYKSINKI